MSMLASTLGLYLFGFFYRPLFYAGLALQTAYIISRGLELDRLPLVGPHDTLAFMAAAVAVFSVPFAPALKDRRAFHGGAALMCAVFTALALVSKQHNSPLPPVLRTFWFETHVVTAFLSYALFGISALLGLFYLRKAEDGLDGLHYRAVLIGYCLFSVSMVFGGVWAYLAWGSYWLWTPKELWTGILWLFYSLYLHARLRQWWAGRPMAYLAVAGFAVVLFTYLGVSLLMKSSHSF